MLLPSLGRGAWPDFKTRKFSNQTEKRNQDNLAPALLLHSRPPQRSPSSLELFPFPLLETNGFSYSKLNFQKISNVFNTEGDHGTLDFIALYAK